jgi:hypothetical protein
MSKEFLLSYLVQKNWNEKFFMSFPELLGLPVLVCKKHKSLLPQPPPCTVIALHMLLP